MKKVPNNILLFFWIAVFMPLTAGAQKQDVIPDSSSRQATALVAQLIQNRAEAQTPDFYRYDTYQRQDVSFNEVKPDAFILGPLKKYAFLLHGIKICDITGKLIIPMATTELATHTIYKQETEKTIIRGMQSFGEEKLLPTVQYADSIRLMQEQVINPISEEGLSFYRYWVVDTLPVNGELCIHLSFQPDGSTDYGFSGHLYLLKATPYSLQKTIMTLPPNEKNKLTEALKIIRTYTNGLPENEDIVAELHPRKLPRLQLRATTQYSNHSFDEITPQVFRTGGETVKETETYMRDDAFWQQVRGDSLAIGAELDNIGLLLKRIEHIPFANYALFAANAIINNCIETGTTQDASKFNFTPVRTFIDYNSIEKWRFKIGGETTANLHPQIALSGYYAYGLNDRKSKYQGSVEYSFKKKAYPQSDATARHAVSVSYKYDLMSMSDRFLKSDKNRFTLGGKIYSNDQQSYVRNISLQYCHEMATGFAYQFLLSQKNDRPAGSLFYRQNNNAQTIRKDISTTEAGVFFRYAPGETFINTRQQQVPVQLNAPVITLAHTLGLKGVLGGEYHSNISEVSLRQGFWMPASGNLNVTVKAARQWNQVPFPLLVLPATNLSWFIERESFSLLNNMEILNDQYVSLHLAYNINGALLHKMPFFKNLKWKEILKFNTFYGDLSDKNNPHKNHNLFLFPTRQGSPVSFMMGKEPYMEAGIGVHNIFGFFQIEYVRRLNYLHLPDAHLYGFRIAASKQF